MRLDLVHHASMAFLHNTCLCVGYTVHVHVLWVWLTSSACEHALCIYALWAWGHNFSPWNMQSWLHSHIYLVRDDTKYACTHIIPWSGSFAYSTALCTQMLLCAPTLHWEVLPAVSDHPFQLYFQARVIHWYHHQMSTMLWKLHSHHRSKVYSTVYNSGDVINAFSVFLPPWIIATLLYKLLSIYIMLCVYTPQIRFQTSLIPCLQ